MKTRSLAVLLFLFFLLLGFNHFVEEGLAELVDVIHALLGKAPKIKFKKGTHFIKCQLSLGTFLFLISNGILGPFPYHMVLFGHFFLKSAIRTTIDIARSAKGHIQQRHLMEFRSERLEEILLHFVRCGQLAERDGFQMVVPRHHLMHELLKMLICRLDVTKGPYHQIMDACFYRYVEHHFQMVHIGKHGKINAEPRHGADGIGVELLSGVIPGANRCAELEVVEGVADGRGVFLVDERHVLQVGGREEAG